MLFWGYRPILQNNFATPGNRSEIGFDAFRSKRGLRNPLRRFMSVAGGAAMAIMFKLSQPWGRMFLEFHVCVMCICAINDRLVEASDLKLSHLIQAWPIHITQLPTQMLKMHG